MDTLSFLTLKYTTLPVDQQEDELETLHDLGTVYKKKSLCEEFTSIHTRNHHAEEE